LGRDYQPSQDEKRILAVTRELMAQFNPKAAPPNRLEWREHHGSPVFRTRVPSDAVLIYQGVKWSFLTLPRSMMGRLDPEDWRPIIASSMIYSTGPFHRNLMTQLILKVVLSLVLGIGVIDYLLFLWGSILGGLVLTLTLAMALVIGILGAAPITRKGWLKADDQAAKVLGRESLLNSLSKIDTMGLKDIEQLKSGGWRTRFAGRPSIMARIENLQSVE
jgi:hypothetical protein